MSYVSYAILIGVKCLRIISHRPETYNLVQKATINETIFESALKLALVMQIFLSSRVAGLGRLSAGANMAMKPFVKRVITIFATNASFLRAISNFRI